MAVTPAARLAQPLWWPGVAAWTLWALAMLGLAAVPLSDQLLRHAGRPDLAQFSLGTVPVSIATVSGATVGAVLASRRPRHPVGWLLLAVALCLLATGAAAQYLVYGLLVRDSALPATDYAAKGYFASAFTALILIGFVLLLTPTGSLPSAGWRWWARSMLAALVVVLAVVTLAPGGVDPQYLVRGSPFDSRGYSGILLVANQVGSAVALLAVMVAAGSLAARFRRARGVEHQQLRWVALAALVAALASVAVLASLAIGVPGAPDLFGLAAGVCLAVVPVAIGAAILRYRLYDLDRIISRTLAYGLLTVLLGGSYAGVVLGLGQLPGRSSSPVVAAATLAVAGMLQPARRRIQQAVDRRFNRRRYHVAQTIAAFSARLRDQVDLDTMTADLVAVVEETMQPTQGSLWLRPPQAPRPQFEPSRPGSARGMMHHERGPASG
jgi:hypothetical protein